MVLFVCYLLFRVFMNIDIFFKIACTEPNFIPVFSSTSFLKFYFQFYFILGMNVLFVCLTIESLWDVDRDVSTAILLVFIRRWGRLFMCRYLCTLVRCDWCISILIIIPTNRWCSLIGPPSSWTVILLRSYENLLKPQDQQPTTNIVCIAFLTQRIRIMKNLKVS